jgi:Ser/Thr protein kinase RdoA (MazF antagonist)
MVTPFERLSCAQRRAHLADVAARAAPLWGVSRQAQITLLNLSENATYRIDDPQAAAPLILRVHRTGYHSLDAVRSELAWMKALQDEAGVETPQALPARDGQLIHTIVSPDLDEERFVVMFAFIAGHEPPPDALTEPFQRLGALAARMHHHARSWVRPSYFERLEWDFEGAVGRRGNWGDWRDAPGLDAAAIDLLEQLLDRLAVRLERFGMDDTRFGLIHADLRLANLLITANDTRVIDFDDAGLGWYLYDVASAVSFMEEREDLGVLIAAWVAGYRSVASLSRYEEAEIPTFLMLRRIAILAWIGSHPDTDLAQELGLPYTQGSLRLAQRYLAMFPN